MLNKEKITQKAVSVLKTGALIVYPTETCYGLGADATNPEAIKKVYKVKKRSFSKPLHIIVSDLEMAGWYCEITPDIMNLVESGLGPLNIVTRKKKTILDILNPKEICFRIPSGFSLELVRAFGKPITATSANISGEPVLYRIAEVRRQFEGAVGLIIDGGDLPGEPPATIVDMKAEPRMIREGSVKLKDILKDVFF